MDEKDWEAAVSRRDHGKEHDNVAAEDVEPEFAKIDPLRAHPPSKPASESDYVTPTSEEVEEEEVEKIPTEPDRNSLHLPAPSSTQSRNIVSFSEGDPGNPYNWNKYYKAFVVAIGVISVMNSTIGSSIVAGDSPELMEHFNITRDALVVLPTSIYLAGYVIGPLLFSPLSESFGRWWIMIGTFAGYTIFTVVLCVSPNYTAFIIFRFLIGVFASSPISVTGGIYADLYKTPIARGRAMAMFMTATTWGPNLGPPVSGFAGLISWRWPFWITAIIAGVSWIPMAFLPETYGPTILANRAKRIRKQNPGMQVYAAIELHKESFTDICTKVLTRPVKMFYTESIVFFSCLYLASVYGIFYMFLQAYPVIFPSVYNFSQGEMGLCFLSIGVGSLFSCATYLWWDRYLENAKAKGKAWARSEESRRLPLACIAGPFCTIGLFWLGWTARKDISWLSPAFAGVPYGFGFLLLFMALINYIVDAYEVYAASALAAAACARSLLGTVLPFAADPMYSRLGIAWATSLLGFISLLECAIPFVFIKYGDKIRRNSKFCQELARRKKEMQEAEERRARRAQMRAREAADDMVQDPEKTMRVEDKV